MLGPFTHRLFLSAIVATLAYLGALTVGPPPPAVHFGVWMPTGGGEILVDTQAAPLVEGLRFGWVMTVNDDARVVREELILPSAPRTWIVGPDTTLSEDRTRATTVVELDASERTVDRTWRVLEGDPPGKYLVRIYVDDVLAHQDSLYFESELIY